MELRSLFFVILMSIGFAASAQTKDADELPLAFLIGEHEDNYLGLSQAYPAVFVALFDQDMDAAYAQWGRFLMDIEDYAARLDFDLKGVKLWMNLYFRPDGRIAHIAYYPKPNSRLVPNEHLTAFFRQFAQQYKLPVTWDKGFQHSASATFPTHFTRAGMETVRKD
jgi:hypothetical protein